MTVESLRKLEKNGTGNKNNMTNIKWQARGRTVDFPRRPLVMGIVNITDDSFSGDGQLDSTWALTRATELVAEGADLIDVGGESARTNRPPVSEEQEWERIRPFVERFHETVSSARPRDEAQLFPPLLSINTWRPAVAKWSLDVAGDLLNDMSALPDDSNARICAETGAGLLIMHSVGEPKVAHTDVTYRDVMADLTNFFDEKIRIALRAGVVLEQILLDPGIDFAKQMPDNLRIYRELESLACFSRPILLPVSRKGVIGRALGISDPAARDAGTVASIVAGCLRGASIFRVHNVDAAWHTVRSIEAVS